MYGYIEGRQALLVYPLPIALFEVGQGDEAAVEEGVAKVVVLDVEGATQAGRVLVHEAEWAVVVAALDAVECRVEELQPQLQLLRLAYVQHQGRDFAFARHFHGQARVDLVKPVAHHVTHRRPVDRKEPVPLAYPGPLRRTPRLDAINYALTFILCHS